MPENNTKSIKHTLTRMLAAREHSKSELLKKLQLRDFEYSLSIEWIDKYAEHNLQSDERFADAFIRGRVNKGIGEVRILRDLREHNIAAEIIQNVMFELQIDWFELALTVFKKRFPTGVASDWKDKQKQYRFMQYRGFSQEQISYAFEWRGI